MDERARLVESPSRESLAYRLPSRETDHSAAFQNETNMSVELLVND